MPWTSKLGKYQEFLQSLHAQQLDTQPAVQFRRIALEKARLQFSTLFRLPPMSTMEDKVRGMMEQLQKEHEKKRELLTQAAGKSEKIGQSIQEYSRQKLENEMVLKELELLSSDSTVMKQIGPCLIKQDMFEATGNVKKRIEYISDELSRLEKQKEGHDKEHRDLSNALGKIQDQVRTAMNEMRAGDPAVA